MTRRQLRVLSGGPLSKQRTFSNIDLIICALGYESRAPYIAQEILKKTAIKTKVAISFDTPNILEFNANKGLFTSKAFHFLPFKREETPCLVEFKELITSAAPPGSQSLSIVVDISCMSRKMLALLVEALVTYDGELAITVEFLYAAANYHEEHQDNAPTVVSEPVTAFFAGWTENPNLAASMIMGLGFEYGRAIGTIEDLQPSHLSLFLPKGEDARFEVKVRGLNEGVLRDAGPATITYNVLDPLDQVSLLYSTLRGYSTYSRPILVPLGPKIFALSCLIAALNFPNEACIWRVSPEESATPVDQVASGTVVSMCIALGK
jgi:hypothetical protein